MPTVGEPAPDIDALATGDGRFKLSEQRGRRVVVYFYPRANTPG
jgi:peroxiredoxin Q/BCP